MFHNPGVHYLEFGFGIVNPKSYLATQDRIFKMDAGPSSTGLFSKLAQELSNDV